MINYSAETLRRRNRNRKIKTRIGCTIFTIIFIVALVAIYMFGGYVGGEVCLALGWPATSGVVNFIVGMIVIGFIASVVGTILSIVFVFLMFIFIAIFGR